MNLNRIQERILELFSIFVTQVKGATTMSRTDINRVSEVVLVPVLSRAFNYPHLRNLNYTEYFNYPGIDLGDMEARVAIQVTSTTDSDKVKDTLTKFVRHELYKKYDRLIIYILTEKQSSYSGKGFEEIIQGKFDFDKDRDIIDYRDVLKAISSLQVDKARRIERILEANFGRSEFSLFDEYEELPTEKVHLNLLEVFFPTVLYQADLTIDRDEVIDNSINSPKRLYRDSSTREVAHAALAQQGFKFSTDWECHEGKVITFHDLNDSDLPLTRIIDQGTVTPIKPAERYFTVKGNIDENRERVFKSLLRRCLQQKLYGLGVQWQVDSKLWIFSPISDEQFRKEESFGRLRDERTVFKRKMKTHKPNEILYCRHFAFRTNYKRFGKRWFLQIMPDWFFSFDGYKRSFFSDQWLTGLKRLENQQSVFNHFRFIEHYLKNKKVFFTDSDGNEKERVYPFLSFGEQVTFDNAPALKDNSWNPPMPPKAKAGDNTSRVEGAKKASGH
jgi:hypothetical protein